MCLPDRCEGEIYARSLAGGGDETAIVLPSFLSLALAANIPIADTANRAFEAMRIVDVFEEDRNDYDQKRSSRFGASRP
ncbi:hypothetical protein EV281_11437 [Rhizobium sp. BK418]|nr:hypothetical protein EV281_11437 [Rhizobium sp. BK418]